MTLIPPSELQDLSYIENPEVIKSFIKGAVYCWLKNNPAEPFAVRDLVDSDWNDTPLQVLYDKHIEAGKDEKSAFKAAAIDLGWIVKTILAEDERRTFVADREGGSNSYRWDGNEHL
jgi:hypothetical protein